MSLHTLKDESNLEDDEDNECHTIRLLVKDKKYFKAPWLKSLIVKVVGKQVGFKFLKMRVQSF